MKIKNDYTNGLEIEENIANVLEKQKKTFNEYVEELAQAVINKGAFVFTGFGDLFPEEFDGFDVYELHNAFINSVMDTIHKKTNFKAKLFLAGNNIYRGIEDCTYNIDSYSDEIRNNKDIEVNMDMIYGELSEIQSRKEMSETIKKILTDESIDENNIITVAFLDDSIMGDENDIITIACPFGTEYDGYEFDWPKELVLSNETCEEKDKTFNEHRCWIKIPANFKITLKMNFRSIELTGEELKQAMKRPADFKTQTEESIKNLKEKYNK